MTAWFVPPIVIPIAMMVLVVIVAVFQPLTWTW
jgi:hypothetical protein